MTRLQNATDRTGLHRADETITPSDGAYVNTRTPLEPFACPETGIQEQSVDGAPPAAEIPAQKFHVTQQENRRKTLDKNPAHEKLQKANTSSKELMLMRARTEA